MVYSCGVTELDGIQDLEESTLDQGIVTHKVALVGDAGEQVALGAELHHDVRAVRGVHDAHEGNHVGVLAGNMVQANLPLPVFLLSSIQPGLDEGLNSEGRIGVYVNGEVDDTVSTDTQNTGEFQPVGQNKTQTIFRFRWLIGDRGGIIVRRIR